MAPHELQDSVSGNSPTEVAFSTNQHPEAGRPSSEHHEHQTERGRNPNTGKNHTLFVMTTQSGMLWNCIEPHLRFTPILWNQNELNRTGSSLLLVFRPSWPQHLHGPTAKKQCKQASYPADFVPSCFSGPLKRTFTSSIARSGFGLENFAI